MRRHHGGNTSCRDRGVAALNGGWWGGGGFFFRRVHWVVRASVSRENMGGGWYWLAQLKKALEPQTNERDWLYPNDNYW